ncbi:uncharacterized protein [Notamacropus eugenii]|uniref:uncharacterized protein n=1 Tax=Notamacropus eugenii TaxID=9315 RepID=UPI003B66DADC
MAAKAGYKRTCSPPPLDFTATCPARADPCPGEGSGVGQKAAASPGSSQGGGGGGLSRGSPGWPARGLPPTWARLPGLHIPPPGSPSAEEGDPALGRPNPGLPGTQDPGAAGRRSPARRQAPPPPQGQARTPHAALAGTPQTEPAEMRSAYLRAPPRLRYHVSFSLFLFSPPSCPCYCRPVPPISCALLVIDSHAAARGRGGGISGAERRVRAGGATPSSLCGPAGGGGPLLGRTPAGKDPCWEGPLLGILVWGLPGAERLGPKRPPLLSRKRVALRSP